MGSSIEGNIFNKILAALPSAKNPAAIRGMTQKWRDDFPGNSLNLDNWEVVQLGSGQSITVNNSELQIAAGTTTGSETIIRSKNKLSIPVKVSFLFYLSQRILNQSFTIEVIDGTGTNYARWSFSGFTATSSIPSIANSDLVGSTSSFSASTNTSSYVIYEIDIGLDEVKFSTRFPEVGNQRASSLSRNRKIPDPNLEYFIQIRVTNTGTPASNTNILFDSFSYQISELLTTEITGGRGSISASEGIPIIGVGGTFPVSGSVNVGTITTLDNAAYLTETTSALAVDAVYQGGGRDTLGRKSLTVFVATNQPGVLFVDWGPTSSGPWYDFPGYNCTASENNVIRLETPLRFYRIRYVNGATAANPQIYTLSRFL